MSPVPRREKVSPFSRKIIFWILVTALLILRIPLASWLQYFKPATSAWIEPGYEVLTYLIIAFLVWWERQQLALHHLDFWAILIILIFKPLSVILLPGMGMSSHSMAFPRFPAIAILLVALVLAGLFFTGRIILGKPDRRGLIWFIIGSLVGIALYLVYGLVMIRWLNYPIPPDPGPAAWLAPFYQLGYAAVSEEPLFRGFLWGGLRKLRVNEFWILIIQAVLFTSAHIHLLDSARPALFFSLTFFNALLFGLIVWRSRSLASSLGMHGFANGSVLVQYWIYSLLLR